MTSQIYESEKLTIEEPIVEPFMSFSEEPIEEPIEEPSIVGDVPIETSTDEHTLTLMRLLLRKFIFSPTL